MEYISLGCQKISSNSNRELAEIHLLFKHSQYQGKSLLCTCMPNKLKASRYSGTSGFSASYDNLEKDVPILGKLSAGQLSGHPGELYKITDFTLGEQVASLVISDGQAAIG